jgi:hypothetical protein
MSPTPRAEVSICIVSLNCWPVLRECLESLRACPRYASWEVILVDNASADGTVESVSRNFPEVRVIRNDRNVGFTRATNQGFAVSSGRHLLWLNPDTIVRPDSIARLIEFLEQTPRAGVVGPKVVNPDGSFQEQCRRGLPTPSASLFHLLRFDRMWPTSRRFGEYLLTYMPVEQSMRVVSVSGCCLLARRAVWDEIGRLDEAMFGFGEDIDWCLRAAAGGWEVWYQPESVIVHRKGHGGAHSRPYRKVQGIHQCMWLVYRKHLARRYAWPMTPLVGVGIGMSFFGSVLAVSLRRVGQRLSRALGQPVNQASP